MAVSGQVPTIYAERLAHDRAHKSADPQWRPIAKPALSPGIGLSERAARVARVHADLPPSHLRDKPRLTEGEFSLADYRVLSTP